MKKITLSKDISFPLEIITQSVGLLAKRRVGKSYTARKLAEGVFDAGQQICIIDPKGDWWGIRYASDGKSPGRQIYIFGGEHGDIPLDVNGGHLVAKLLVEEHVSVLLDLSMFRKTEIAIFMTAFLEDLYRLKAQEKYRTPLMLLVDEADAIAPQKPQPNEARMLGAIEDIVRRGGQRGIGCTVISQRSAVLNKNVLTQTQVLICLRTIAPQDLAALDEWIQVHGERDQRKILMESLPSLPVGDAWVWSPGWPTNDGIFKRIHVDPISTFDSGATPAPGEKKIAPRNIARVDLEAIKTQMSEVMEKAKDNDPSELKKKIRELEAELKKAPLRNNEKTRDMIGKKINEGIEQNLAVIQHNKDLQKKIKDFQLDVAKLGKFMAQNAAEIKKAMNILEQVTAKMLPEFHAMVDHATKFNIKDIKFNPVTIKMVPAESNPRILVQKVFNQDANNNSGLMRMLKATASFDTITRARMAIIAGLSPTSGSFNTYLSSLKKSGWIEGDGRLFRATAAGKQQAGPVEPMPLDPAELIEKWCSILGAGSGTARMLRALYDQYPHGMDRNKLAESVGMSGTSGSFNTYLSTLKKQGLISKQGSEIGISKELFE